MRKTLKRMMTGGMLLTVAASMVIVFLCLLVGTMKYSSTHFANEMADVFTTDTLTQLNAAASGTDSYAVETLSQAVDAYAGQLRIGSGREYSIWDAESGEYLGGSISQEDAAVTDNIITAMNGIVGDHISLFSSRMDIAVPVNGEAALVIDVQDDGSDMRQLCGTVLALYGAALVISLLLGLLLSWLFSTAFTRSAVQTARELREQDATAERPNGDWEALAAAMLDPQKKRKKGAAQTDALQTVVPYLSEGYLQFDKNGKITFLSDAAQQLLRIDTAQPYSFETVFPGVPMPSVLQKMVHGQFTHAGQRLDVVFLLIGAEEFAAIVRPVRGYTA